MLTPEEFRAWCVSLQLPRETEELIASIRSSPPVRRVKGHANNVAGRYPSPKMQLTVQFESQHVELWAIYGMERDDDVLEYYDQPVRLPLRYRAKSGRNTTQWHTPDFFVLRQAGAGFEEWKPAHSLDKVAADMPNRYQVDGDGKWRCPPGEAYAKSLGLSYRVRSSAEYHPHYIQNLKFLQDFWAHPVPIEVEKVALVLDALSAYPGISLAELRVSHPDLSIDVVWAMIATGRIFTDLETALLTQQSQVMMFRTEEESRHASHHQEDTHLRTTPAPLVWDGRIFQAESLGDLITLRPEEGEAITLSSIQFQHLVELGAVLMVTATTPSPTTPEIREALSRASPKAQQEANARLRHILAYRRGEPITVTPRSIQRWTAAYRAAEEQHGCGYLGLLPHVADRGNRTPRISEASQQLLEAFLKDHYATPIAKRAAAVYRLYRRECEQRGLPPVGERTFYRVRKRFTTEEVTSARLGRRAAYAQRPFFWYLDQITPRHGERPFAIAHLDHTELDLMLVSSITGKPLEKPWLTLLTDAYSRRVLAAHISYDDPSYRSAMMIFRACVQRYQRLPQELVVDRGADFGSVYFETLLSRYSILKKERPPEQPRFGSLVERLFGTTTTELLNQLQGNTQATKIPRQMTREVDPKQLAVWTLERFSARFSQWVYEVYDQMEHQALFQSPRDAFAQGMALSGPRTHRLIPYSEEFIMLTRPTTRTGQAKVDLSRGITVNWLHYWNPAFRNPDVAGSFVPVRYEPYDMGVVYAFVRDQWLECIADEYAHVHGRSEREWHLILDEWRAHQRQHGTKRITVNSVLLADFLEELTAEERVLMQQQRDHEERSIREAILLKRKGEPLQEMERNQEEDEEFDDLDLATIPRYEEYR
jgi:putative transposase